MLRIKALSLTLALIALAVVLGTIVGRQITIQKKVQNALDPDTTESVAIEVSQLIKENQELRRKRNLLAEERTKLKNLYSDRSEAVDTVEANIDKYKVVAGVTEVTGPGVILTVDHELALTQLVDLINAIRNSGAETMALNERRIVATSSFGNDDLGTYFKFEIVGDKAVLSDALMRKGGILDQITNGKVEESDGLTLAPVSSS